MLLTIKAVLQHERHMSKESKKAIRVLFNNISHSKMFSLDDVKHFEDKHKAPKGKFLNALSWLQLNGYVELLIVENKEEKDKLKYRLTRGAKW